MNFPGVPGAAAHFHGAGPAVHAPHGHQGQDIMMEQGMMGAAEGFHDGQNMGHHHGYPSNLPQEMDYRLLQYRQASVNHAPVSAVCFDTQELLWAGTHQGHVSSYYGSHFDKYTAYHASPQGHHHPEIQQLLTVDDGVLALTSGRLRINRRTGQTTHRVEDANLHDMLCMIQTAPDTVLLGGQHNKLLEVNTQRGQIVNKYQVDEAGCAIFRHGGKYLCGGDTAGKVILYDPATMRKEHVLEPGGVLADFDVQRNLIITCGMSKRTNSLYTGSSMAADRLLMVYDMRVMRAMAPIQVNIDPTFLRFVPSLPHHLVVVSQMGTFQLTETATMTTPSMMIFPIEARGSITSFDLSKSCQAMAFGDAAGMVHLFSNHQTVVFSGLDLPTIFADHVDPPQHEMHLADDLSSLATLPMEYPVNDSLLSEWPPSMMRKIYRKPKPLDPEIVRTAKMVHNMGCASNPRKVRRNQIPYKLDKEGGAKRQLSVPESPIGRGDDPFKTVPKEYQRMLMRYTKLDDFDFRHYNKTNFAGLTAEHNNSYCNGMLQMLYFVEPLRAALLSHVCQREFCLACELGFLFHMLDTKKGEACQAKNFLRAFRTLSEAAALGLLLTESEEVKGQANLLTLIPSWHRFLIQQINSETCQQMDISADTHTPSKEAANMETASVLEPAPAADTAAAEKKAEAPSSSKKKRKNKRGKKKEESKTEPEPVEKEGEEGSGEDSKTQEEHQEDTAKMVEVSVVRDLFFLNTNFVLVCRCGRESLKDEQTKITILTYPPPPLPGSGEGYSKVTFAEVLHHSLTSESPMQTWCNDCGRYTQHVKRRQVTSLPDVLAVDCNLSSENNLHFWREQVKILKQEKEASEASSAETAAASPAKSRTQCRYGDACRRSDCRYWHGTDGSWAGDGGDRKETQPDPSWIPLGLRLRLKDFGDLSVEEVSNEEPLPKDPAEQQEFYEVYAIVYVIEQPDAGRHLVSCIRVGEPFHLRKERVTCHQWYLFNDFCIQPIEKPEYVSMDLSWKTPSVVYYSRRTYLKHYDNKVVNWCGKRDILYDDPGLVNRPNFQGTYLPLQWAEVLNKGDLVGLDAEFISLKEEEAELRSDGTKSTIKPSHVSPGRITCIRGQGEHFGQPFIDDYVLTPEQVTDYLTEFSGIQPSELDPSTSTKHLTTLKSTYQKLRCLLDIGVIFVGHGLKKDFKVINLQVPKEQIVDTVQLFHLPNKRFISLRFLAWFFLEKNIQSGQHDSAEDARTAVLLYQRYQQLKAEGAEVVKSSILDLYETGRKMGWKVPDVVSDPQAWTADPNDPAVWAEYEEEMDRYQTFYER